MSLELIVPGKYVNHTFIPDGPLPDAEGMAELIIKPNVSAPSHSIFDLFGKAPQLRTMDDISAQLEKDRAEWGEP